MGMPVYKTRHDGLSLEVDDPRYRSSQGTEIRRSPNRRNVISLDRDRLGDGELIVDSDDLAVLEQEVGGTVNGYSP